jgi:hypothetical protein
MNNQRPTPCPFDGKQCRSACGMWAWIDTEKKLGGCSSKIMVEYLHAIYKVLGEIKDAIINDRKM